MKDLIKKLLAKTPDGRPAEVETALRELEAIEKKLEGEPARFRASEHSSSVAANAGCWGCDLGFAVWEEVGFLFARH